MKFLRQDKTARIYQVYIAHRRTQTSNKLQLVESQNDNYHVNKGSNIFVWYIL